MLSLVPEYAKKVGMEQFLTKEPGYLSGGQKQKVAIASVLDLKPRVLVLDEPTAELDPASSIGVFDLLAPSLKLDPNMENYPFSVKPDSLVKLSDMVRVFQDYYEGTEYDMRKNLTVTDKEGKSVMSPLANPFMKSDELKLHKINGGWHEHGERNIAVWFTVYATILQCRADLPDEVGALCWFCLDKVASSVSVPIYANCSDLPDEYETCGRETGFSRDAAWWGFNRLGTLACQRWGDMRKYINAAWQPMQKEFFDNQSATEQQALQLLEKDRAAAIRFLTQYTNNQCKTALDKAWETGDLIWTKFDGAW